MQQVQRGREQCLQARGDSGCETFDLSQTKQSMRQKRVKSMRLELAESTCIKFAALRLNGEEVIRHSWLEPTEEGGKCFTLPFPVLELFCATNRMVVHVKFGLDFGLYDASAAILPVHLPPTLTNMVLDYLHPRAHLVPTLHYVCTRSRKHVSKHVCKVFRTAFTQYGELFFVPSGIVPSGTGYLRLRWNCEYPLLAVTSSEPCRVEWRGKCIRALRPHERFSGPFEGDTREQGALVLVFETAEMRLRSEWLNTLEYDRHGMVTAGKNPGSSSYWSSF